MILTCPSCAAQFNVNPNALGETGRTVRCGKCKHQWHASRPLITLPADDLKFAAGNASGGVSSSDVSQTPPPVSGVTQNTIAQDKFYVGRTSIEGDNEPVLPDFSADVRPGAKRNAVIAAIVLAGLLSIPAFMMNQKGSAPHEDAVKAPLEKATQEVKPAEKKEDKEIVLDGTPTTLLKEEQGRTILSIEGALINKTTKTLTVPILQAQALNAKGKVVKEWIIPIVTKEMDPGMRQPFTYSMPFNEQGVVDIAFHFL